MIHHIVLCKFRADVSDAVRQQIFADLDAVRNVVPGMASASFGANISPENLAKGFTHGFIMTFADTAARDAYLAHPDHVAAGGRLVAALEGGMDGLCVVDI